MTIGVYQLVNRFNGKRYIGSSKEVEKRIVHHFNRLNAGKHINPYLQSAFNKQKDAFLFTMLEFCTEEKLLECEQAWLDAWYDNQKDCYNLLPTAGSHKGSKRSPEWCKKMGDVHRGKIVSKETIDKIQATKAARTYPRRYLSTEHKEALRASNKSRKYATLSPEHKEALCGGNRGKPRSPETKEKIATGHRGKKLSPAHREALRQGWVKRKANPNFVGGEWGSPYKSEQ